MIYLKLVKFVQPYSPYAVDDITGLSDKLAEKLLAEEICVPFKEEKGASKKSEEKTEEVEESTEEKTEEKSVEEPKVNKMVEGAPVQK